MYLQARGNKLFTTGQDSLGAHHNQYVILRRDTLSISDNVFKVVLNGELAVVAKLGCVIRFIALFSQDRTVT